MKIHHTPPRSATWTLEIFPYRGHEDYLVEDAPHDENTRAIYQLNETVREFLSRRKHRLVVDRGDFGDGDEHFKITFYREKDANDFLYVAECLRGGVEIDECCICDCEGPGECLKS